MVVKNNSSVQLTQSDLDKILEFEYLVDELKEEVCNKISCNDCSLLKECDQFYKEGPYDEGCRLIDFFKSIPKYTFPERD